MFFNTGLLIVLVTGFLVTVLVLVILIGAFDGCFTGTDFDGKRVVITFLACDLIGSGNTLYRLRLDFEWINGILNLFNLKVDEFRVGGVGGEGGVITIGAEVDALVAGGAITTGGKTGTGGGVITMGVTAGAGAGVGAGVGAGAEVELSAGALVVLSAGAGAAV
jgi:hypothetical protein